MAIINRIKDIPCLSIRKKMGIPGGFGDVMFGVSKFGYFDKNNGVYQMRYPLKPAMVFTYDKKKPKIPHRIRYTIPTNPRTPGQQLNRAKFLSGMDDWRALSPEVKQLWVKKARLKRMPGHALFMREYMLDRD